MKKTLFDYFSIKRKEASNENGSDSQESGHSSVESPKDKMSLSTSDRIETTETCIDLEECSHITPTTDVHEDRGSEPRLFDAPTGLNTERTTSIFGAAVATTEDESGSSFTDLDSFQKRSIETFF